jgi:hypothetical protein
LKITLGLNNNHLIFKKQTMKTIKSMFLVMLMLTGMGAFAQDNACTGLSTEASEGTFTLGYNFDISTVGTDVVIEFQLLDPKVGLVAFAQTFNPDFAETPPLTQIGDPAAQTFGMTFPGQTPGAAFNVRCKFAFAGGLATTAVVNYVVGEGCAPEPEPSNIALPVTFEDTEINYELQDFGGNTSQIITDPEDAGNLVVESIKGAGAETFAGTTVADVSGFSAPIPFAPGSSSMTVRVWSPVAGVPVRLKVEQVGVPSVSVETEATTTVAMAWETLTFNFANQAAGTAAISFGASYNKATIFFNFDTNGATAGEQTYYWDDVAFLAGEPVELIDLPVTFEDSEADYGLTDFGGAASSIVTDPQDGANTVAQTIRTAGAETFAGTTVGGTLGFANPIPFVPGSTSLSVRVLSPAAGVAVRLKVENSNNPGVSVETESTTTAAGTWETLAFNFNNEAAGTAAINLANEYNKATIFFNFGVAGAPEQVYFWDDIEFVPGEPVEALDLPIDFENDDIVYGIVDFAGTASSRITDPTDPANTVVQTVRGPGSATFAGTLVGEGVGFANPIAFTPESTVLNVRVWSPVAGIQVRLKAENLTNPNVSVETEATTTVAMAWETLSFDFANEAAGTAAINFASQYTKLVIFFNFGVAGGEAGEQTFYWDDVQFPETGCTANGGTLEAAANRSFCVGTGSPAVINVTAVGASGTNLRWALIDGAGNVVETRGNNSLFNLDTQPAGDYSIRYIRFEDDVTNLGSITNISQANSLVGCFGLSSNAINLFLRDEPVAGTLTALTPTTVCANAGGATGIQVGISGNTGEFGRFGITSGALGQQVVASNNSGTFNLNGFAPGNYSVGYISYQQGVNVGTVSFPNQLQGCFDLSNLISLTIQDCAGITLNASPNPSTGTSFVEFSAVNSTFATLEVYDMAGRKIADLFNQNAQGGAEYRLEFNGHDLPNGVYMYRLTTDTEVVIEKFMIAK